MLTFLSLFVSTHYQLILNHLTTGISDPSLTIIHILLSSFDNDLSLIILMIQLLCLL